MKKYGLAILMLLPVAYLSSCSGPAPKVESSITDLGDVYGLAFDGRGNLFAVGSDEKNVLVWKIGPDSEKKKFAVLDDTVDKLGLVGIANHSLYAGNMAVDGQGKVWIASREHGACFVVSKEGRVFKVYLNSYMSIAMENKFSYPGGVAWDESDGKLLIVTSGPQSTLSSDNFQNIVSLTPSYEGDRPAQEAFTINDGADWVLKNKGIAVDQFGRGLIKGKDSPLYFIGNNGLFKVGEDGTISMVGEGFGDMTLWGGTVDETGNIYLTANGPDFNPDTVETSSAGKIIKVKPEGGYSILITSIAQPLGITWHDGSLYVADRATGSILKITMTE